MDDYYPVKILTHDEDLGSTICLYYSWPKYIFHVVLSICFY